MHDCRESRAEGAAAEEAVQALLASNRTEAYTLLKEQPELQRLVQQHGTGSVLCIHFIAAHPQRQGQGLGSQLLQHICKMADQQRQHLYLEASSGKSQVPSCIRGTDRLHGIHVHAAMQSADNCAPCAGTVCQAWLPACL